MTTETKPKRSLVGIELVRLLANEGDRVFSIDRARELAPRAGVRDSYLGESLYHLRQSGWIVPLRRGLYALASTVPGVTPAHEFEVAMALVAPAAISHWSALHYHGLTTQIPSTTFVLTTHETSVPRLQGRADQSRHGCRINGVAYRFVQVRPGRFFGTEKVWVGDARVSITDLERTLVDGLTMPQHCGGFAGVLRAFEIAVPRLNVQRISDYALRLDAATGKRLGWVLEHLQLDRAGLDRLAAVPITGYRKLNPRGPRNGRRNARWMVEENLPGMVDSQPVRMASKTGCQLGTRTPDLRWPLRDE